MERFTLTFCVFSVLLMYVEAACWGINGEGPNCEYEGVILAPGQTYEKLTGPRCYKCKCFEDGSLDCCDTGNRILEYPDTCKVVRRGCHDVAVSKTNENELCEGAIGGVLG